MMKLGSELPTQDEIDRHMATHIPFRSWCSHCVRGRGQALHHTKGIRIPEAPVISLDYMYMNEDSKENKGLPLLVRKDRMSRCLFAEVVPQKGRDILAIKRCSQVLGFLGYKRMILKSDQEASIVELKECIKKGKRRGHRDGGISGKGF